MNGITIIIPAYNAEGTLRECLQSITALKQSSRTEIILVNDGSADKTSEIAASFSNVKTIDVPHKGAARAINIGVKAANHDIIAIVEADVTLEKDWLEKIIPAFDDPSVAAVGGCVVTANRSAIGKLAGYDVELRLGQAPADIDNLSMTNTAYRRQILIEVGLISEDLKAGYDVDLSRRLKAAGYRLILKHEVRSRHYWKDNLGEYLRQQYNYAYYRMTLTRKFGLGKAHDRITGPGMILQLPFTLLVLLFAIFGSLIFPWATLTLFLMLLIHVPETILLLSKRRDIRILLLPLLFTVRNLSWVWASAVWETRYLTRYVSPTVSSPGSGSAPGL